VAKSHLIPDGGIIRDAEGGKEYVVPGAGIFEERELGAVSVSPEDAISVTVCDSPGVGATVTVSPADAVSLTVCDGPGIAAWSPWTRTAFFLTFQ